MFFRSIFKYYFLNKMHLRYGCCINIILPYLNQKTFFFIKNAKQSLKKTLISSICVKIQVSKQLYF